MTLSFSSVTMLLEMMFLLFQVIQNEKYKGIFTSKKDRNYRLSLIDSHDSIITFENYIHPLKIFLPQNYPDNSSNFVIHVVYHNSSKKEASLKFFVWTRMLFTTNYHEYYFFPSKIFAHIRIITGKVCSRTLANRAEKRRTREISQPIKTLREKISALSFH